MIEHIARFPRVRDRAIFVGNPRRHRSATPSGPGLPLIRDWTEQHFDFAGYVTGFDPADVRRPRASCAPSSATGPASRSASSRVGGSGVGGHLLQARRSTPLPEAKELRARAAHDRRRRAAHRPGTPSRGRRARGARLRPRPLPPPGRLRPRRRPGRPDHGDGADREPAAVPLLPAAPPLRAELPRPPPARALRRGSPHGLRDGDAGRRSPQAIAEEIGRESTTVPVETDGAARAAARIAELL